MFLEQIEVLKELTLPSILLRTVLVMLISGVLGYEREKRHRPAGFRTYLIVCLGSMLAMMTGIYLAGLTGATDASRLPAQVISGIGFLGAGTILVTKQNQVRGLTTAAGLWSVACLGLAIGAGFYTGAIVSFAAIWVTVKLLRIVDRRLYSNVILLHIEFEKISDMSSFITYAKKQNCTIDHLEMNQERRSRKSVAVSANIALRFDKTMTNDQFVETFGTFDGVISMETI